MGVNVEVTLDMRLFGEEESRVFVQGEVEYHIDENWGADADGHRGERRVIVDEIQLVDIEVDGKSESEGVFERGQERYVVDRISEKFFAEELWRE